MKLSVVIPSYNSGPGLQACLLSLNHQEVEPGQQFEVVVVDDGSDDGTESLVRQLKCDFDLNYLYVPRTARSGRSAARNSGIEAATGEIVVLVDADEILPPRFLAAHLDYHRRRPDLVVAGPRGYLAEGEIDIELLTRGFCLEDLPAVAGNDSRDAVFATLTENFDDLETCWHYMFSCNVSVRRDHLLAAGGFDESFVGWGLEDSELGYRLRQRGLVFAYNHDAVLYHQHRQVIGEQMYLDWRKNLTQFTAKYADHAEVAAQWVFDRSFNPASTDVSWQECCRRFEYAVRALHGRLPRRAGHVLVEVDDGNRAEILATLPRRAESDDLVVIDHLGDSEVAAVVQCLRPGRELAYFRRPSAPARQRILTAFMIDEG
jgi:glycosyltransferase involved in cell wall biosynthesis